MLRFISAVPAPRADCVHARGPDGQRCSPEGQASGAASKGGAAGHSRARAANRTGTWHLLVCQPSLTGHGLLPRGQPAEDQRLYKDGVLLEDNKSLVELQVECDDELAVAYRLEGKPPSCAVTEGDCRRPLCLAPRFGCHLHLQ